MSSGRPRIRTIKPEANQDERIGALSRDARLLFFTGLVTMADDEGRLRAMPALILGHAFPYDDDVTPAKLSRWLGEIEGAGLIVRYEHGGRPYVAIRHFRRHQRIDKPSESTLPSPPDPVVVAENSGNGPGAVADQSRNTPRTVADESCASRAPADRIGSDQKPPKPPTGGNDDEGGNVVRFDRRRVPPPRLDLAERILVEFNEQAGTNYGAYTGRGRASEDLRRIIGALTDAQPPLEFDEARRIIAWRLRDPFWEGRPHTGVVFGPKVLASNRESAMRGPSNGATSRQLEEALRDRIRSDEPEPAA